MASYLVTFGWGGCSQRNMHGGDGRPQRASWDTSPISLLAFCILEIPINFLAASWFQVTPGGLALLPPRSHELCYWLWCSLLFPQEVSCPLLLEAFQSFHFGALLMSAPSVLL